MREGGRGYTKMVNPYWSILVFTKMSVFWISVYKFPVRLKLILFMVLLQGNRKAEAGNLVGSYFRHGGSYRRLLPPTSASDRGWGCLAIYITVIVYCSFLPADNHCNIASVAGLESYTYCLR